MRTNCDSDAEESHEEDVGINSSNDAEIDLLNSSVGEITRLPCIAHKVNICVVNCIEKKQHAFGRSHGKCRLYLGTSSTIFLWSSTCFYPCCHST